MTLKDLKQHLDLHLKDYDSVRADVDDIKTWTTWALRIILGAIIVALLMLVGLK